MNGTLDKTFFLQNCQTCYSGAALSFKWKEEHECATSQCEHEMLKLSACSPFWTVHILSCCHERMLFTENQNNTIANRSANKPQHRRLSSHIGLLCSQFLNLLRKPNEFAKEMVRQNGGWTSHDFLVCFCWWCVCVQGSRLWGQSHKNLFASISTHDVFWSSENQNIFSCMIVNKSRNKELPVCCKQFCHPCSATVQSCGAVLWLLMAIHLQFGDSSYSLWNQTTILRSLACW